MPRTGLNRAAVVEGAAVLADEGGAGEELSLARLEQTGGMVVKLEVL